MIHFEVDKEMTSPQQELPGSAAAKLCQSLLLLCQNYQHCKQKSSDSDFLDAVLA